MALNDAFVNRYHFFQYSSELTAVNRKIKNRQHIFAWMGCNYWE